MTPNMLENIMADIAEGDPLDFGGLSISEGDARQLMASHLCEVDEKLNAAGLDPEERLAFMAAIAAHSLVENMLLNIEKLRSAKAGVDELSDWLARHGMKGTRH
jgi:hypothetical protein